MVITKNFLTPNPYSRPGTKLTNITKIAVHYVGNPGSSAAGNRGYFESLKDKKNTYASSHYIIGLEGEIIQCIPENEIAYCTNQANSYSLSIENCHPAPDGKFNDKTVNSLIELCADICQRYKLDPLKDIIRHYDVTQKACPLYYVKNPSEWSKLKTRVKDFIDKKKEEDEGVMTKMKLKVDNQELTTVDSILKDSSNYPNLRQLSAVLGYSVDYDAAANVVMLTRKK